MVRLYIQYRSFDHTTCTWLYAKPYGQLLVVRLLDLNHPWLRSRLGLARLPSRSRKDKWPSFIIPAWITWVKNRRSPWVLRLINSSSTLVLTMVVCILGSRGISWPWVHQRQLSWNTSDAPHGSSLKSVASLNLDHPAFLLCRIHILVFCSSIAFIRIFGVVIR